MWQNWKHWWNNYKQKRTQKRLNNRLEQIENQVRDLLHEKHQELTGSPSIFAQKVLRIKPFPYQIKLLEDQNKRIVACMGRQSGKTTTIAMKAIHYAHTNPNITILITSPSLRQSMIMFDRMTTLTYSTPHLRNKIVRTTRTLIQFENKSKIIALPCSENLLRGYTAHMIIADEAAFMPEHIITQIIFPMLSTTDGHAIFLSTPWGKNHFFHRAFANPTYSAHKVKSNQCPLIKPEFLEEMRQNMTREAYLMEYEAEFAETATSYFPQDLIRSCIDPTLELKHHIEDIPPQQGKFFAGVDLGKLNDYSVLTIVQKLDKRTNLILSEQFPLETSYSHVIGTIVKANNKFDFQKILVDKSGVGEVITEEITTQGLSNTEGQIFSAQTKAEMLANLKVKMQKGAFKMPYDRNLCEQINQQQYEYTKSGQLKFWHPTGAHDDQLWALA